MNVIQKRAFILGYLQKEAIIGGGPKGSYDSMGGSSPTPSPANKNKGGFVDNVKGGWDMVTNPTKAYAEFERAGLDQQERKINDRLDRSTGTTEVERKRIAADPEEYISKKMKNSPMLKDMQKKLALGFAAAPLATMGTGLLTNMAANKRHSEMMKAMSSLRGGGSKRPAQAAFRLPSGQNRTGNYYG